MKKHLLSLPFLIILCICISAHSTIERAGGHYINSILTVSDTIKSASAEVDSAAMNAIDMEVEALNEALNLETWRQWKTVGNFAFGKDRGNLPMIADLNSLHPYFRDRINTLIKNCKAKGIELAIVETYRTHAKQKEYYQMGKKYTRSTGGMSKHQYGLAVDVVPVKDSVAIWDNVALWKKIGAEGEKLGLRWGGRWKSPYDPAHFEWSGGLTTYHLSTGAMPPIPKVYSEKYPCIHEDLDHLKKHWEMWETEQSMLSRGQLKRSVASSQNP